MADKEPKYPIQSLMQQPDQSQYVYTQAADYFLPGTFISVNQLGRLVKFRGGLEFPQGIIVETVLENFYTWVMIKAPAIRKPSGLVIPDTANPIPPEHLACSPKVG